MFKKLLSNLPFNPSLITQVSFYAKRLHREEKLRRIGMVLVALSVIIQVFAVISPPEPTLADSPNDIIYGGFGSKSEAVGDCRANSQGFATILKYYGVSCDLLASSKTTTTTIRSNADDYHSIGRTQVGNPSPRNGKNWTIYPVQIPGISKTLWMKDLQYWDSGAYSSYKVLQVTNAYGDRIMIMYDCGNIVTVNRYTPPPPPQKVVTCGSLTMSVLNNARLTTGDTVEVRGLATGKNLTSGERADMYYDVVNAANGNREGAQQISRGIPFTNGVARDPNVKKFSFNKAGTYKLRLAVKYNQNGVTKNAAGNQTGECVKQVRVENLDVCPDVPGDQTRTSECYSCPDAQNGSSEDCLEFDKTASNTTQNIPDANNTTANAGDTIVYKLRVTNTGDFVVEDFEIKESLVDVLEYAEIVDLGGGQLDDDKVALWPKQDIQPDETVEKTIVVKVKDPIPQTPTSASDPGSYDLVMSNAFYDKQINIHLPESLIKTTERVSTTLPSTGPGTNIAIAVAITVIGSYFFARNKLMAKELDIVREEFKVSGA